MSQGEAVSKSNELKSYFCFYPACCTAAFCTCWFWGAAGEESPADRRPKIRYPYPTAQLIGEAFVQGLRDLGWVDRQNVAIEYRYAEGNVERLPDLAAELVGMNVNVFFAGDRSAALAAKRATSIIPIVFSTLDDPVRTGLVASLARPGGNLTGLAGLGPELSGKRLELLKEVVPKLSRVALLVNPSNRAFDDPVIQETEVAARSLGIRLQVVKVSEPDKLDAAFSTIVRDRAGAVMVLADAIMFTAQRNRILGLVKKPPAGNLCGDSMGAGWWSDELCAKLA